MIASSTLTQLLFAAVGLTLLLALVVVAPWLRRPRANLAAESASTSAMAVVMRLCRPVRYWRTWMGVACTLIP